MKNIPSPTLRTRVAQTPGVPIRFLNIQGATSIVSGLAHTLCSSASNIRADVLGGYLNERFSVLRPVPTALACAA